MEFDKNKHLDNWDDNSGKPTAKPNAWRVEDDENLDEKNLERNLYGKSENNMKPVKEGQPMGGQSFGKNSNTPAGDDKNNPSQNAGYSNAYFARTEPLEEHTESNNFKPKEQDGEPNYAKAQPYANLSDAEPKPDPVERGNGENDKPHKGADGYQEGTADNENEPNIPGPNELSDQQKVGEDVEGGNDHVES
ncbi:hypothetical protein KXD93_23255 [Mucilaginibacter sp. BJC16-A38]|uniref:hypothetical protein n=1 Tax=Mucilaginibacter phenanthrenivorans TaxID=1234842 RepID=UPI0021577CFB|nr:hypothetical protein [Mucilaginibacter phenanthrenivorans]MCR8560592.1 hypothetical protein [Mucilaginibacter phenanthrenivorans]